MTKKELLLKTAKKLFATQGYAGTSIDDISKPLGITKSALYYHFKDKQQLYEIILESNIKIVADAIEKNVGNAQNIEDKLQSYITTFAKELDKNKDVSFMLMREMSNGGKMMPTLALKQMIRTLKILSGIIQEGVEEKIFQCVEPMLIQMMVVGSITYLINTENVRIKIKEELDPESKITVEFSMDEASKKIASMVRNSLKTKETL